VTFFSKCRRFCSVFLTANKGLRGFCAESEGAGGGVTVSTAQKQRRLAGFQSILETRLPPFTSGAVVSKFFHRADLMLTRHKGQGEAAADSRLMH
jgi:hypothetical protein